MLHWQSASRLLIVMLALAIPWPAAAQTDAAAGDDVLDAGAEEEVEIPKRKRRDPSDWTDWRNYEPSIGGGFGVTFDHADSTINGTTKYENSQPFVPCFFDPEPQNGIFLPNCEPNSGSFNSFFTGGAFYVDGRVMLPEFDVPSKPRLFASVAYVAQNQDQKVLANTGFPRSIWLEGQDAFGGETGGVIQPPFLRLEQTIDPKNQLFAGIGGSFLLPVDSYPIRLNVNFNYYRSQATIGALYDMSTGPRSPYLSTPDFDQRITVKSEMITQGIAPGAGIDIEIGRLGWASLGLFSNVLVGIPLADNDWDLELFNGYIGFLPEEGFNDFKFERGINVSVFVGVRVGIGGD